MNGIVVRKIRRADGAVIATLGRMGVATVHEAQGRTPSTCPWFARVSRSSLGTWWSRTTTE
jgi:4-hydroxy-4-methyl-2-oxoglutarate aldolase